MQKMLQFLCMCKKKIFHGKSKMGYVSMMDAQFQNLLDSWVWNKGNSNVKVCQFYNFG